MIVFCCPKCKMTDIGEENEIKNCMRCGIQMLSLGISSVEWNDLTSDQMKEAVETCVRSQSTQEDTKEEEKHESDDIIGPQKQNLTDQDEGKTGHNFFEDHTIAEATQGCDNIPLDFSIDEVLSPEQVSKKASRTKKTVEASSLPLNETFKNEGKYTRLSIAALVCSILGCVSVVGIILGIIDLVQGARSGDNRKKALSITAIAVGTAMIIICFLFTIGSSANRYFEMQRMTETIVENNM